MRWTAGLLVFALGCADGRAYRPGDCLQPPTHVARGRWVYYRRNQRFGSLSEATSDDPEAHRLARRSEQEQTAVKILGLPSGLFVYAGALSLAFGFAPQADPSLRIVGGTLTGLGVIGLASVAALEIATWKHEVRAFDLYNEHARASGCP